MRGSFVHSPCTGDSDQASEYFAALLNCRRLKGGRLKGILHKLSFPYRLDVFSGRYSLIKLSYSGMINHEKLNIRRPGMQAMNRNNSKQTPKKMAAPSGAAIVVTHTKVLKLLNSSGFSVFSATDYISCTGANNPTNYGTTAIFFIYKYSGNGTCTRANCSAFSC